MDAQTLRRMFHTFYTGKAHAFIGSAPLLPEHDPSVLFTTAGMHPLVPFLLGEPHPAGRRLANWQKCVRTNDIMEVGDDIHLTFFEMMGVWSLGDYWKDEAIRLSYTFITEVLGLEPERLHVTCFAGDDDAPRDDESAAVWRSLGIPPRRITFLPKADNWWGPAGITGPCGPDSEMFYDTEPDGPPDETPATNPRRFWEIGNNVFMQYDRQADGTYTRLAQRNIDVGLGFERLLALLEGVPSAYETSLFVPIVDALGMMAVRPEPFALRLIADHLRGATMILAEGVRPGNAEQAYVLRRLIRRAIRYGRSIGIEGPFLGRLAEAVTPTLAETYPELAHAQPSICAALDDEESRFRRTLARGEKEVARAITAASETRMLPGSVVFRLYDTFGFPAELTAEIVAQQGLTADLDGFQTAFAEHQERSRQGSAARFRGGLAERNPATTMLHTATHLLHAALRQVLGPHVEQRGSNITTERLRFDFLHGERLTAEQLAAVEDLVNAQIARDLQVCQQEMSIDAARDMGAIGLFGERYGEQVKVYAIGDFSVEICGGPHVARTSDLGHFRIVKEEAVAAGIRRIRAIVQV
jgi:alanyl-tRNA synthetase